MYSNSKDLTKYIDSFGLMGQKNANWIEGGDSAQRTGFYHVATSLSEKDMVSAIDCYEQFQQMITWHEIHEYEDLKFLGSGIFRRHPDIKYWYSSPDNFSRDQARPLVIAMGLYGDKARLFRMFLKHMLRFGFYQNVQHNWEPKWDKPRKEWEKGWHIPDIMGPIQIAEYTRAFKAWPLWPLLWILDIFNLASSITACFKSRSEPRNTDYLNKLCSLVQGFFILPTPISALAIYIFFRFTQGYTISEVPRPSGEVSRILTPSKRVSGPQYFLDYYFGLPESPPLNETWRKLITKINSMLGVKKT